MAAAYQVGYRIALITGSALALALADKRGWHMSYTVMAALVSVGVITTLLTRGAQRARPGDGRAARGARGALAGGEGPLARFLARRRELVHRCG
jgi:predicted MFS family arabinose efflux permease